MSRPRRRRRSPGNGETWQGLFGARTVHSHAPEFNEARAAYVKSVYDLLSGLSENGENTDLEERKSWYRAAAAARSDLFSLVDESQHRPLHGFGERSPSEWAYPVRGDDHLGEVRWPEDGADVMLLHHRAYFATPRTWPTELIWLTAAAKPDSSLSDAWHELQDETIELAITIRTLHYRRSGCCG